MMLSAELAPMPSQVPSVGFAATGTIFHASLETTTPAFSKLPSRRGYQVNTVKNTLAQKNGMLVHVRSDDVVQKALQQMRDNRVRSVLVIDDDVLVGIVTQGDCAIKVLLPGLDAKETVVSSIMTRDPMTVKLSDQLEACMGLMAARGFRHLPVLDGGKVVGVISIGDLVKDIIREMGSTISFLETYIKGHGVR
jgi:CBS domain-containing protein